MVQNHIPYDHRQLYLTQIKMKQHQSQSSVVSNLLVKKSSTLVFFNNGGTFYVKHREVFAMLLIIQLLFISYLKSIFLLALNTECLFIQIFVPQCSRQRHRLQVYNILGKK